MVTGGGRVDAEVLKMAASQGFFAVLFVVLLFYVLRENAKREEKYQSTINILAEKFDVVDDIRKDVVEIKENIKGR